MNKEHEKIRPSILAAVFLRALLIQASWSFDRMQALGFAFAIEPALRKLYPDRTDYESRLRLHREYFNTQPCLASFILGAAVRMEENRAADPTAKEDVSGMKAALMAPLGALGDSFFWGALKPLAAVVAVALLITGQWWAPILFLVSYNVWHVGLRAGMLFWGYQSNGDAMALMVRYNFTKMAKRFKVITLAVLGGMLAMVPVWRVEFQTIAGASFLLMTLPGLAVTLIMVEMLKRGGSPIKLMLGLAAVCLALAYAGSIA